MIWGFLVAAVLLAVAVPAVGHLRESRERAAVERMTAIAERVRPPVDLQPLRLHQDCHGDGMVRCGWTADRDVDGLAQVIRTDLTERAGRQARLECSALRSRVAAGLRSCLVQVTEGQHAVTIFVDPYLEQEDGQPVLRGARYSVSAG